MTAEPSSLPYEDQARTLGRDHASRATDRRTMHPVRQRLKAVDSFLSKVDDTLREGDPETRRSPAREWLLDNRHLILEALLQVRQDLTRAFIRELPMLEALDGRPTIRILEVARELVRSERAHVDLDRVRGFLRVYQEECPLTMGELWAFPLLLRITLLDELSFLGGTLVRTEPPEFLNQVSAPLQEEGSVEERTSGAIRSLRAAAREDWNRFFEATSRVDDLLRKGDPARIYARMDFPTRDRYRKTVEESARASGRSEEEVAGIALEMAGASAGESASEDGHLGRILVGRKRREFEKALGCRIPVRVRLRRLMASVAFPLYAGSVYGLSVVALLMLVSPVIRDGTGLQVAFAVVIGLVPALAVGISLVNSAVPRLVPPRVLPKLSFERGIPDPWRTAVAVPCLLTHLDEVDGLLGQIEMNFLGNRDRNLTYVLLTDYGDASEPEVPGEDALLEHARTGVRELNQRHGSAGGGPFVLLHRARRWNEAEGRWMGWERKRGKLEEFNNLLLEGDLAAFPEREGNLDRLREIRFVLTLDADTFLPQGAARRLVGTLAHPLNRPHFDGEGRVAEGYTILQPRVEVLPDDGARTPFSRVFEADRGLDLYSQAVSDVYQDVLGEGIFTGKGLYDVAAFQNSLEGRVPENALLSHDLFEGVHGRSGLVTDVVLFEDFPSDLRTYLRRLHRWVRGDWQLLPWLLPRVPSLDGPRVPNPIDLRGRWKILDNLRRSLLAPSLLALFLAGWFFLPGSVGWWTGAVALVLAVPILLGAGFVFRVRAGVSRSWALVRDRTLLRGSGILRWVLALVFLPHQARIEIDAIVRTLYRLAVSRRRLLEWTTAAHAARQARERQRHRTLWREMAEAPALALAVAGLFLLTGSIPIWVVPLLLAWFFSPVLAWWTGTSREKVEARLTEQENLLFRSVARRTWSFFEEFVGPGDHWLPPDHFQESPRGAAAHRTSPTNVGLTLTAALAAYDLGYLTISRLVATLSNTLDGMKELDRHRGHLLNWYDTRQLTPLEPRYVSTVDSGNLAACLLIVGQSCRELAQNPVLRPQEIQGLLDTIRELEAVLREIPSEAFPAEVRLLERLREVERTLGAEGADPRSRRLIRRRIMDEFIPTMEDALAAMVGTEGTSLEPEILSRLKGWIIRIRQQAAGVAGEVDELMPWVPLLHQAPLGMAGKGADPKVRSALQELSDALPPDLPLSRIPDALAEAKTHLDRLEGLLPQDDPGMPWIDEMEEAIAASEGSTRLLHELSILERRALEWVERMDFRFLYSARKRLFHIGFDVSAGKLDESYYDLLASEARIASFLASAKGDVPTRHWLQLGRPFGRTGGSATLLSWAGTMFEYLMPPLFLATPRASLLAMACRSAIDRQMAFGTRHRIPWGISESSYNHLDTQGTYQYRAFGIPELAIRREVGGRLVVSPYASLLALPFRPRAVRENVEHLVRLGMFGRHGLYEAIDFGRAAGGRGEEPGIVRTFMAHHQGMILAAVSNHLTGNLMVERFGRDPRTAAAAYLLYERTPSHVRLERRLPHGPDRPEAHGRPAGVEGWSPNPDRDLPSIHVLSNESLSALVTARGGGGLRWQGKAMTRWRADPSVDEWGSWIYIQDLERDLIWSAAQKPAPQGAEEEAVVFAPHRIEYRRRVQGVSSHTTVLVPRDGNVEIRRIVLTNLTGRTRRLRLASYGEVALADVDEDRRHPAFQKLFVESTYLAQAQTLHFRRRRASPEEPPIHLAHGLGETTSNVRFVRWETDREAFLGRGGSRSSPAILQNRSGAAMEVPDRDEAAAGPGFRTTLDPIFSLILEVDLSPGEEARVTFLTSVGSSSESVLEDMDRFRSSGTAGWAEDRTRARWEENLHDLDIPPREVQVAQRVWSAMVRPFHNLRTTEPDGQPYTVHRRDALWGLGISGDHPVLLLRITHLDQEQRLEEVLRFHALWRRMGIRADVVILDQSAEGYHHPIRDRIVAALSRLRTDDLFHRPAGVHHLPVSRLDPVHQAAVEAAAHVRLDATLGSASDQLRTLERDPIRLPPFVPVPGDSGSDAEPPSLPRPTDLLLDNGFGGFSPDGREYVIQPPDGEDTPAPWINVVATPEMGFIVSERGSGFTWAGNSAEHRLTSWANDPILDRTGEALYIRDEETGDVWSPTPAPSPGPGPYQVRHGAGYSTFHHRSHGLDQQSEVFAAFDPAAKVWNVRLENLTDRPRRLTVTFFAEWTLGGSREQEAPHVVTRFDPSSDVLTAENRFAPAAGPPMAFLASDRPLHSWTMDHEEFLGRGGLESPAGMHRIGLAQGAGGHRDPCGGAQIHVNLDPHSEAVVHFFLGAAKDMDDAAGRVRSLREPGAVKRSREGVASFWEDILSRTRVSTPDPALDLVLNRWARYQSLSCRIWGRSALYQSAGAFGFRDQLQDVLAFLMDAPSIARDHILKAARHQFVEGDVLHWWHPPEARGVRSRCSDDLLWLPFAVASYVRATGDTGILEEEVSFLTGPLLATDEQEHYSTFSPSDEVASLHEHCLRALRRGMTQGPNGLPLIGLSDWNDGMDRLGRKGRGESVWLAWFSSATARAYAEVCREKGDEDRARELEEAAGSIGDAAEAFAWDGDWYLRATHDDGSAVGSSEDPECRIDSISQSWSLLSGVGDPERAHRAMESLKEELIDQEHGLALLLTPPFDRDPRWPGYIRAYPPGVRENGGQYSHAATWAGWALAALGEGAEALRVFRYVSPLHRTPTREDALHYRIEPYAVAGDVAGPPEHPGRGGWSWFTGSATWLHRLGLEAILGIRPDRGGIRVDPCIPPEWPSFQVELRRGGATYRFRIENPDGVSRGVTLVELDGDPQDDAWIPLEDGGHGPTERDVRVVLGPEAGDASARRARRRILP